MPPCPNQKRNLSLCNCSYEPCARKGMCCECILYHRQNKQIPACFFPDAIEKTFDRSISNFVRAKR
jgi:hypothetical protein